MAPAVRVERLANPIERVAELLALRIAWMTERHPGATLQASTIEAFGDEFRLWVEVEQAQREFWLAWHGNDPVAMVNLLSFDRMPSPVGPAGGWGYLCNMFVLRDFRNSGVGEQLARSVIDRSRALRHERIVLSPSERSRPFWGRLGFASTDGKLLLRYPNP